MDNIISLLTTREGRIPRSQFWLGAVVLAVAGIIINLVLSMILGVQMFDASMLSQGDNMQDMIDAVMGNVSKAGWISLIMSLVFFVPVSALFIKRLHDRNMGPTIFYIYYGIALLSLLVQALGLSTQVVDMNGLAIPTPTMLSMALGAAVGLLGLYLLVVCGFLKGTDGDNQYGPDPLANKG